MEHGLVQLLHKTSLMAARWKTYSRNVTLDVTFLPEVFAEKSRQC